MPLQATSGAASYDAFGGGAAAVPNYIEDVFSCFLYTGNATTGQSINNGIDLATKGGLLWCKNRTTASTPHYLFDTARDFSYTNAAVLNSASTAAQEDKGTDYAKPETNGFSFGSGAGTTSPNKNGDAFVSWTFRKQPKFFDVVTWTGSGANRTISHSLGSVPACIIVKRTDTTGDWQVYHRSLANTEYLVLNTTAAKASGSTRWNSTTPTSTEFSLGTATTVNANGGTYVAYIFAHDAGGFGLTGTDNVISCGSFTTDGSGNATVSLGYEPQWVLIKQTDGVDSWYLNDNMRGMAVSGNQPNLSPNSAAAESAGGYNTYPNATGFTASVGIASKTYIYIAIRRGPMKVPTSGTSVFSPITNSASTGTVNTTGFPVDMGIVRWRTGTDSNFLRSRLQGVSSTTTESGAWLKTNATDAESTAGGLTRLWDNTGFQTTSGFSGYSTVYWNFRRAPSFFDEVCYTGNQTARTISHNLAAAPELMITKNRSSAGFTAWLTCVPSIGMNNILSLNTSGATDDGWSSPFTSTPPTSSVFSLSSGQQRNETGVTYVAYLFATCAGVSKVGSYTGTATTKQIDCGFTAGARFVLIKKTSGTGSWYVWDSARGIVSGNDPYLLLNSTAAEVTNTDYIDTYSAGFEISSTAPSEINENGGSFIFLAIA